MGNLLPKRFTWLYTAPLKRADIKLKSNAPALVLTSGCAASSKYRFFSATVVTALALSTWVATRRAPRCLLRPPAKICSMKAVCAYMNWDFHTARKPYGTGHTRCWWGGRGRAQVDGQRNSHLTRWALPLNPCHNLKDCHSQAIQGVTVMICSSDSVAVATSSPKQNFEEWPLYLTDFAQGWTESPWAVHRRWEQALSVAIDAALPRAVAGSS